MSERNPNKKVANSLVAMSSAAVLAVYAAGYTRTQAAAEKLDTQSEDRRPSGQVRGRGPAPVTDAPRKDATAGANPEPVQAAERTPSVAQLAAVSPAPVVAAKIARPLAGAVEPPASQSVPPASNAAVPEPAAAPVAVVEHKPEPVAVVAPPPPPPPPAPKWKDGTYTGWGTSRHGDIQAQVVIEEGRIKAATIAQCYTRYSCDVIDKIIPQVAARQSPETDYVSGATQSTNAFYYGVVDALSKAK